MSFRKSIFLSFASPKERNKEKETTKTNFNFLFHTKPNPPIAWKNCSSLFSWTSAAPLFIFFGAKINLWNRVWGLNKRDVVSVEGSNRLFLNFCFFFFKKKEKHTVFENSLIYSYSLNSTFHFTLFITHISRQNENLRKSYPIF